jgi:hypothetical protein
MGIFDSIMNKLGFGDEEKTEKVEEAVAAAPEVEMHTEEAPAVAEGIIIVDVTAQLEALADASAEKLDWKVSIVDLMKLLGLDSSYGHRKELARELNCPDALMGDSAKMNMWLHKTVLTKLAENGGNVPADLLD